MKAIENNATTNEIFSPDTILDKSTFGYIFSEPNPALRKLRYIDARKVAAKARKLTAFEKRYKEELAKNRVTIGGRTDIFNGSQPEFILPNYLHCDASGVWYDDPQGVATHITAAPLYIDYAVRDETDPDHPEQWTGINFVDTYTGQWKTACVSDNLLSDKSAIKKLASYGILFDPAQAGALCDYFYRIRTLNGANSGSHPIPVYRAIQKLGWLQTDDGWQFAPYDNADTYRFAGGGASPMLMRSFSAPHGTLEAWTSLAKKPFSDHLPLRIFLDASIASVLIKPLGGLPFVIHLYGETGFGKTIAIQLAISIWGDPSESGAYYGTWEATKAGMELKNNALCCFPMPMDDTAKLSEGMKKNITQMVYELAAGKGRTRATKSVTIRADTNWCNVCLSTGEHDLLPDGAPGGADNRVTSVFVGKETFFDDPVLYKEQLPHTYGTAGRAIIKYIKQVGFNTIAEEKAKLQKALCAAVGGQSKQAANLAMLLLADYIACKVLFKDIKPLAVQDMIPYFKDFSSIDENRKAYDLICTLATSELRRHFYHAEMRHDIVDDPGEKPHPYWVEDIAPQLEAWGKIENPNANEGDGSDDCAAADGCTHMLIMTRIFTKILQDNGFDPGLTLDWLDANDLLIGSDKSHRSRKKTIVPGSGFRPRVYDIRIDPDFDPIKKVLSYPSPEDFNDSDFPDEIPF